MITIYDFYAGRSSYATPVCYIMIVSYRCDIVATIFGVFRYGEAVELHSQIHLITQSVSQLLGRPHKGFPLLAFALGVGSRRADSDNLIEVKRGPDGIPEPRAR